MVTAPLSPSQGRGGRSGGLNHSFNNRGGPGRGLRGQASPQSHQTGNPPDQQLLTQNQVNRDNPFHINTTKVSDEWVRNNPYEALQDDDDDSTAEVDNCEILDFHKENEQESIDDDSEVEIDFTQPQQTKGSPLPEHILTTPPRKQSKRKICSPAVETANLSVETDADAPERANCPKSPVSPQSVGTKQDTTLYAYRIDTRLVRGQDYHLWKLIKQAIQHLVGDAWVFPNPTSKQAIQMADIGNAPKFDELFNPKYLRRGHRIQFYVEEPIDVQGKMSNPDIINYFTTNRLFLSNLTRGGKDYVCHSVFFGIQPSLVPRKALEEAIKAHLSRAQNEEVRNLFLNVKSNFHIFSKSLDPKVAGTPSLARVYGLHVDPDEYAVWSQLRSLTGPNFGVGYWAPFTLKNSPSFKESLKTQAALKRTTQVILIKSIETPDPSNYGHIIAVLPHLKRQHTWMILAGRESMAQVRGQITAAERMSDNYEQTNDLESDNGLQLWATRLNPTPQTSLPPEAGRRKLTKRAKLPTVLLIEEARTQRPWSQVVKGTYNTKRSTSAEDSQRKATLSTRNARPINTEARPKKLPIITETTENMEEDDTQNNPAVWNKDLIDLKQYLDERLDSFSKILEKLESIATGSQYHTPPVPTSAPDIITYLDGRLAVLQDIINTLVNKVDYTHQTAAESEERIIRMIGVLDDKVNLHHEAEQSVKGRLEKMNTHISGLATAHRLTNQKLDDMKPKTKQRSRSRSRKLPITAPQDTSPDM
jgi:hypothetical protein